MFVFSKPFPAISRESYVAMVVASSDLGFLDLTDTRDIYFRI